MSGRRDPDFATIAMAFFVGLVVVAFALFLVATFVVALYKAVWL